MARPSLGTKIIDFANLFKAFIGSNYLSIAFAFLQSGFVAGVVGLSGVAAATCHCCLLIVTCKHLAIDKVLSRCVSSNNQSHSPQAYHGSQSYSEESESDTEDLVVANTRKKMLAFMTYPDIADIVLGRVGRFMVNACLFFTQYGFCTAYFIFVGNTLHDLLVKSCLEIPQVHGVIINCSAHLNQSVNSSNAEWFGNSSGRIVPAEHMVEYSPIALPLLVLMPLALFILFIFIKNVRTMGPLSGIANLCIIAGCISVGVYLITKVSTIRKTDDIALFRLEGLPIFFGMVTGAFEGIGTIIPIESSMADNRHNFRKFLMLAVVGVYGILLYFGCLGYLEYGPSTAQMVNKNVAEESGILGFVIQILLILGVLLTFPLQIYPVMEIVEKALFAEGKLLGPKSKKGDTESLNQSLSNDRESLLHTPTIEMPFEIAVEIPSSVALWKRYLLRALLVSTAAGLAVLARNFFAFVTALVGSTGSVLLAYIFPCLFHLKLASPHTSKWVKVKNVVLICVAVVGGISCLIFTIMEIVRGGHAV